jgi:hypothetical protein
MLDAVAGVNPDRLREEVEADLAREYDGAK